MRSTPNSTARRRTLTHSARSAGSPQMPGPVILMAPNPNRCTVESPSRNVPLASTGRLDVTVVVDVSVMVTPWRFRAPRPRRVQGRALGWSPRSTVKAPGSYRPDETNQVALLVVQLGSWARSSRWAGALPERRSVELLPDRGERRLHGVAPLPVGPVHHQRVAADVGGVRRAQVGGGPGQLAGKADPPGRDPGVLPLVLAGHGGDGRGLVLMGHEAGDQAVDPDAVGTPLHRQGLGQVLHPGLGRRRMGEAGASRPG